MEFNRMSVIKDHTAATEILERDLPINPISHLIISLDVFNATDEATLAELLAFINTITVSHSGKVIVSMQSEDLYGENCFLYGHRPVLTGKIATDNLNRTLSLIVPFGRKVFDPNECYPETRKGELNLSIDMTAPTTSADNGIVNVEAVELLGATPSRYLKSVMNIVTAPGATGENDFILPLGNKLAAVGIRMTTFYAAGASTLGVESVKLMVNNKEYGYSFAKSQCLIGELLFRMDTQHGNIAAQGLIQPASTMFLDFFPDGSDDWLIDLDAEKSAKLRLDMGVDEATYLNLMEIVDV